MSISYSTERVLDMVLRSLRASGLIADDVSAESIRTVANNASDAELDALAATLNYGGTSGTAGDAIFAIEDFDLVIDSDNSQSGIGPYYQQFRVERGDTTLPITDPNDHLMSIGNFRYGGPVIGFNAPLLTIGPISSLASGADRRAGIDIGYDNTIGLMMARMHSSPTETLPFAPGFRIRSARGMELSANPDIQFSGTAARALRGGWPDLPNHARFAVGDYKSTVTEALYIEAENDSGGDTQFTLRPSGAALRKLFIRGSNDTVNNPIYFVVGGKMDTTWGDPSNYGNPAALFLGSAAADFPTFRVHSQVTSYANANACFEFSTTHTSPTPPHYIFRITRGGVGVFNIDSTSVCNCVGGFTTGPADVAEWLDMEDDVVAPPAPGTVLVINGDGKLEPSSLVADLRVIGVVSEKPGFVMGSSGEIGVVKPEGKVLVAAIGKVSVRCRADNGSIHPGDRLISGPDGCAVRAESSASGAAILGKSLGTLVEGEGKVEALVSW